MRFYALLSIWAVGFISYRVSQSGVWLEAFGLRWGLFVCDFFRYGSMLCVALGVIYGVLYGQLLGRGKGGF